MYEALAEGKGVAVRWGLKDAAGKPASKADRAIPALASIRALSLTSVVQSTGNNLHQIKGWRIAEREAVGCKEKKNDREKTSELVWVFTNRNRH